MDVRDLLGRLRRLQSSNDWERAVWEMTYLVWDPRRVARMSTFHRESKGRWARDDPAFLLLLTVLISVASFAFGLAFFADAPFTMARIIAWTVFVDLVATGALAATFFWHVCNRWLKERSSHESVEWLYCFDVHCNAWFCLYLYVYLLSYVLLPFLIVPNSWASTLLSNSIYAVGITHYCYITFVGYSTIPFLRMTNVFMWPVVGILAVLVILTLALKFNVVIFVNNLRFA